MHLLKYEDLLENGLETLQKLLCFLEIKRSDTEIKEAFIHNSFVVMKKKEAAARETVLKNFRKDVDFVRRGIAGQWEQTLTLNQLAKIEQQSGQAMDLLGYARTISSP